MGTGVFFFSFFSSSLGLGFVFKSRGSVVLYFTLPLIHCLPIFQYPFDNLSVRPYWCSRYMNDPSGLGLSCVILKDFLLVESVSTSKPLLPIPSPNISHCPSNVMSSIYSKSYIFPSLAFLCGIFIRSVRYPSSVLVISNSLSHSTWFVIELWGG